MMDNYGVGENQGFKSLFRRPSHDWITRNGSKAIFNRGWKNNEFRMKIRLADYLGISVPRAFTHISEFIMDSIPEGVSAERRTGASQQQVGDQGEYGHCCRWCSCSN